MKILKLFGVTSLLWLTGCATTGMMNSTEGTTASGVAESGGVAVRGSATQRSLMTGGALQPITAAQAASRGVAQLSPPADLWERIQRGFAMPNLENDLVADREQWYSSRPDYILRMTERSRKYLFHIVEELEMRNMPTELALLPFIESAFNPQAVSSVKATGMWQFMPATGKEYSLKQNVFRDDRRDVLASTRAALDYLQKLHRLFGDWHLALAAYNWGQGSVGRAITKNQRIGLSTGYTDLTMPMETRMYVPKLQAVKNIVANPQAFNSSLPLIGNHPFFQTVDIKRDIDVALAAKLAEVSPEEFKALNPSIDRPVIFAAGTPQILLPWDNATIYQRNLEAYGGGRLASWTVWVAPSTMQTAEAARRVGMVENELRSVNNIPPHMVIKAGSSLLVPRSLRLETDVTEQVADNGHLALAPDVILSRRVFKAKKNDSVASIARQYKVSSESVADWNKMKASAAFKVGQPIVLYLPMQYKTSAKSAPNSSAKTSSPQARHQAAKSTNPTRSTTATKPAKPSRVAKH